jgi:competence protein ComGC
MKTKRQRSRVGNRGNAAFGLIGVLIVMAIVLYLLFGNMGGTTYMDEVQKGRERGQQVSIDMQAEQLLVSVTQYQLANDALPQSMEDLEAPAGAFVDPWGLQVRFTCEKDERSGRGVLHIVSAGPDGEFETEDDLVVVKDLAI